MKSGIKVTFDGLSKLKADLADMATRQVLIGIPATENQREGDPIGNAALGYIHEKGSPVKNIPARPFLEPGVAKVAPKLVEEMKVGAQKILDGGEKAIDRAMNRAGIIAQNSVKSTIRAGEGFAPLAPATLAARKREGYKGEKPLIRTAQMLNSITYVIRKK